MTHSNEHGQYRNFAFATAEGEVYLYLKEGWIKLPWPADKTPREVVHAELNRRELL